jgi:hypothetical protein
MLRQLLVLTGIAAAFTLANTGCRSCSSCHDYAPPVADCCDAYGPHRAGSASGGYIVGGYVEEAVAIGEPTPEMAGRPHRHMHH